jgi:predicted alpha/beta superfamily hydrolase
MTNRTVVPALLLAGFALLPSAQGAAAAGATATTVECKSTVTGDLRLHTLRSMIFRNERSIRVLLPPGYGDAANKDRRYPVLYMLDGQNLFDACLSDVSHAEWGVDEITRELIDARQMPPVIVVGVDHAGAMRASEFLPYKDFVGDSNMAEPVGKQFPDFLAWEVMPLVNANYRTLTGQPHTGIGGSSYGGVAALYALLARPGDFGYGLIESPTLWVGMGQPVRDTNPLIAMPAKVFIGFGGKEAGDPAVSRKMIGLVEQVGANFRAAGYDDSNLRIVIDPDALHTETAWRKRLPDALRFLFGEWKPQPQSPSQAH